MVYLKMTMASSLIGYINAQAGTHLQVHAVKTSTTTSLHMPHDSYTTVAAQEFTCSDLLGHEAILWQHRQIQL